MCEYPDDGRDEGAGVEKECDADDAKPTTSITTTVMKKGDYVKKDQGKVAETTSVDKDGSVRDAD